MSSERKVAIVTDSGSSMRPEYDRVKELGVTIIPLDVIFNEEGKHFSYPDLDITPGEFYRRMKSNETLPTTSGAIKGRCIEAYKLLSQKTKEIISIHITAKHSVACETALAGANTFNKEVNNEVSINVIDSRQLSLGTWFAAEHAAIVSQQGANLNQISQEVLAMLPKINLLFVLETFNNLRKGGRAEDVVKAYFASKLHIFPVMGMKEGKMVRLEYNRSARRSRERMLEMVGDSGRLARLAILHTNAPDLANELRNALYKIYPEEIPDYDTGPALAVHAGVGAGGVAFVTV